MHEPAHLSRRAVATAIPLALAASAAAALPASASKDAALLDLGRRWTALIGEIEAFNDACNAMDTAEIALNGRALDAEGTRLSDIESALLGAIIATPANTIAGLVVKARALVRKVEIDQDIDLDGGDLQALERAAIGAGMLERATLGLLADVFRLGEAAT